MGRDGDLQVPDHVAEDVRQAQRLRRLATGLPARTREAQALQCRRTRRLVPQAVQGLFDSRMRVHETVNVSGIPRRSTAGRVPPGPCRETSSDGWLGDEMSL